MQDEQTKPAEREEYLQIIQKRARVLQGFIQDFYELSRIEGENYPLLFDLIQVQNTLSEVVVAYYHEFEKMHITVEVILEEKQCSIIVDKIQFNRILNNLVQNALKYSKSHFVLKQYILDGECIIRFQNDKDLGTQDDLKNIFDRFYTGDLSRNNQSTGLGLTISKILTEKMKGRIEAILDEKLFVIELRWKSK